MSFKRFSISFSSGTLALFFRRESAYLANSSGDLEEDLAKVHTSLSLRNLRQACEITYCIIVLVPFLVHL